MSSVGFNEGDLMIEWSEQAPRLNLFRSVKSLTEYRYAPYEWPHQPDFLNAKGEVVTVKDWHITVDERPEFEELRLLGVKDIGVVHSPEVFYANRLHPEGIFVVINKNEDQPHLTTALTMHKAAEGPLRIEADFEGHRPDGNIDFRPALESDIEDANRILAALVEALPGRLATP
jgi:hypothetical protein